MEFTGPTIREKIPDNIRCTQLILRNVNRCPDAVAMINADDGKQITFGELKVQVERLGSALIRLGVGRGNVVLVCAENCLEYMLMYLAITGISATFTGISPACTLEEAKRHIKISEAQFCVTNRNNLEKIRRAKHTENANIREIILLDKSNDARFKDLEELLQDDGSLFPNDEIDAKNEVANIPFSSGTTGLPKGVMQTHLNVNAGLIANCNPANPLTSCGKERILSIFPMCHTAGYSMTASAIYNLNTVILIRRYSYQKYLQTIVKYQPSTLFVAPPVLHDFVHAPQPATHSVQSVRSIIVTAAPLNHELLQGAKKIFKNGTFRNGFGMTETYTFGTLQGENDPGVGKLMPGLSAKIVDVATGKMLGFGSTGELLVKGPKVMKGYLNQPEASRGAFDSEGWFRTGDVGYFDKDGNLFLVDRIKEMIKYKGFQVAPVELEFLLEKHSAVKDACVIGIPDARAGEIPKAFVVLHEGHQTTVDDVVKFVNDKVSPRMRLRGGVTFVKAIPKSATGKKLRRVLSKL